MDKFCTKCGAELDENGVCPSCGNQTDSPVDEQVSEETKTKEITEEASPVETAKPDQSTDDERGEEPVESQPHPESTEEPQPAQTGAATVENGNAPNAQPSKFYYAFRQVGNVIKHFFSKNTIEAISAQYTEQLPIWAILLPVCALISALSMTLSFDGTRGLSIGAGSLFSGMSLSGLEVFIISFAMSAAMLFVYSISVMIYLKIFKVQTKFKSAANLTMSAYIAVSVMDLFNITTIGSFDSEGMAVSGFGMIAFALLLYLGIKKVLDNKQPFWSFFLMLTCASAVALIAALVVSCPIIVMRGLEQLANSVTLF